MTASFAGRLFLSSALAMGFGTILAGPALAAPVTVPMDHARDIDGVSIACGGVGESAAARAAAANYPVKLEFVGHYGQYLANERVVLHGANGAERLNVRCDAPWLMMRLAPGHYRATAYMPGAAPKHVRFTVPRAGERQIILRYRSKTAGNPNMARNTVHGSREQAPAA